MIIGRKFIGQYTRLGAKELGEQGTQLYADDPMMQNLFRCCVEYDFPVLIHVAPHFWGIYGIIDDLGLPRIEKMPPIYCHWIISTSYYMKGAAYVSAFSRLTKTANIG